MMRVSIQIHVYTPHDNVQSSPWPLSLAGLLSEVLAGNMKPATPFEDSPVNNYDMDTRNPTSLVVRVGYT